MSIALATKGRLWPVGGGIVIREQFSDIRVELQEPLAIESALQDVQEIRLDVVESDVVVIEEVTCPCPENNDE